MYIQNGFSNTELRRPAQFDNFLIDYIDHKIGKTDLNVGRK